MRKWFLVSCFVQQSWSLLGLDFILMAKVLWRDFHSGNSPKNFIHPPPPFPSWENWYYKTLNPLSAHFPCVGISFLLRLCSSKFVKLFSSVFPSFVLNNYAKVCWLNRMNSPILYVFFNDRLLRSTSGIHSKPFANDRYLIRIFERMFGGHFTNKILVLGFLFFGFFF